MGSARVVVSAGHIWKRNRLWVKFPAKSADFSDVSTCRWNESSEADSHTDGGDAPEARNLRNQFIISEDDRKDGTREMKSFVDVSEYVVYTSKRLDQMTARCMGREMKIHRNKYAQSVKNLAPN